MSTQDIANDLVALWKQGDFAGPGDKYWSQDVVSIEAMGDDPVARGVDAVRGKGEWWAANHEVHGAEVEGPYVNGDQFIVRLTMDITIKASGERRRMDEMALYVVENGRIIEERFFYGE